MDLLELSVLILSAPLKVSEGSNCFLNETGEPLGRAKPLDFGSLSRIFVRPSGSRQFVRESGLSWPGGKAAPSSH